MRAGIVLAAMLAFCSLAHADEPIAIESHAGERTDEVRALIEPVLDELAGRGYRVGAGRIGADASRISRPASAGTLDLRDLSTRAQDGINKWHSGSVEEAADVLQRLWVDVRLNPAPIALNSAAREPLFRAFVTLAMVRARVRAEDSAFDVMAEVIRTYPDLVVTRAAFGPEAAKLYESTRQTLNQQGRGTLTVKVADENVQVFVNERYAGNGTTTRTDLIPGPYRVYLQRGKIEGRYYIAKVTANTDTELEISWPFDLALRTGPYWAGFQFATDKDRSTAEGAFAVQLARKLDAPSVVVLTVGNLRGKTALIGTAYETSSGTARRSASLAITPAPSDDRLRAFARFLAGDTAEQGFDAFDAATTGPAAPSGPRSSMAPGWVKWAIAGAGAASIATGAYLLAIDGDGACEIPARGCIEMYETSLPGGLALAGGTVAIGAAAYLYLRDRRKTKHELALSPVRGGLFVSLRRAF